MELHTRAWHPPTLQLFGVTPDMLPRICSNAEQLGAFLEGPLKGVAITGQLSVESGTLLGALLVILHRGSTAAALLMCGVIFC